MRKGRLLTILGLVFVAVTGCSIEANLLGTAIIQNGSLFSFATSSDQNIKTTGFARVKASGGAFTYGALAEKTENGATVFHHVEGTLLSEEVTLDLNQGDLQ